MKKLITAAFLSFAFLSACKDKDKDNPTPAAVASGIDPNAPLISEWVTDKIETTLYDANGNQTSQPRDVRRGRTHTFEFTGASGYKEESLTPGVTRDFGTYSRVGDQLTLTPRSHVELLITTYTIDSLTAKRIVFHTIIAGPNNGTAKYVVRANRN